MSDSWQDSVVLITSRADEESAYGTGFVIHRDERGTYVLTCTHVVDDVGGKEQVNVNDIPATVIASGPANGIDVAVLCVAGLASKPLLCLSVVNSKMGEPFELAGYYHMEDSPKKKLVFRRLTGIFGDTLQVGLKVDTLVLFWIIEITSSDELRPGNSGSPVVDENHYVIGIVNTRLTGDKKRGWVTPIKALEEVWPEAASLFLKKSRARPLENENSGFQSRDETCEDEDKGISKVVDNPPSQHIVAPGSSVPTKLPQTPLLSSSVGPQQIRRPQRRISRRMMVGLGLATVVGGVVGGRMVWIGTQKPKSISHSTPGTLRYTYKDHFRGVTAVAWSPDSKRIASGSWDHTVRVWNAADGSQSSTYTGHSASVNAVAWPPLDGTRIASGSADHTVQEWDPVNGTRLHIYTGHSASVNAVAWSPDGTRIASGGADHTVWVWNATDGTLLYPYKGHSNVVYAVAWSPDGTRIASGGADHIVQVWDPVNGTLHYTYRGYPPTYNGHNTTHVYTIAWSPDSTRIASGGDDDTVRVWNAADGTLLYPYKGHSGWVWTVAWSPDGTRIASGSVDATVQIWDP